MTELGLGEPQNGYSKPPAPASQIVYSSPPPARERARTCVDHCGGCGGHFHGLSNFDMHRVGSFDRPPADLYARRCADPATVAGLEIWTDDGRCDLTGERIEPVTVWCGARRESARDSFAKAGRKGQPPLELSARVPGRVDQ